MRPAGVLTAALVVAGCSPPRLPVARPDRSGVQIDFEPVVVQASAPTRPAWAREGPAPSSTVFVGRGEAAALDAAKQAARADLLAAISTFVSVDVTSLDEEVQEEGAGSSQTIRSSVETSSRMSAAGLAPDRTYWEKVALSPITPDRVTFHYAARASLSAEQLAGLVRSKQAQRRRAGVAASIALLPFEPLSAEATTLAHAVPDEIGAYLAASARVRVIDANRTVALIPGGSNDAAAVAHVRDALLPDLIVRGSVQRDRDQLELTVVAYDGATGLPRRVLTRRQPSLRLANVGAALGAQLLDELDARPPETTLPEPESTATTESRLAALESFHAAYEAMSSGRYNQALVQIRAALVADSDNVRVAMRMGRIFERMGRFGRIPPSESVARQAASAHVGACTPEADEALVTARKELAHRARPTGAKARPWWTAETLDADGVLALAGLEAALLEADGFVVTDPGLQGWPPPFVPTSAAESYWLAMLESLRAHRIEAAIEAAVALAALAVRIDRLDDAEPLYQTVTAFGERRADLHFTSLGLFGSAVVARKRGGLEQARELLAHALAARLTLGEKPYLLEIYNELGSVSVELGQLDQAANEYGFALRIARALGNDYVEAVVANNLGVLDLASGRGAAAAERFARAHQLLANLGASEGSITAGLNLGLVTALAGDASEAARVLDETERVVATTAQEGQLAHLLAVRGLLTTLQGESAAGLAGLAKSLLIFTGVGQRVKQRRLHNNFLAAQYYDDPDDDARACLKEQYWTLGPPVFEPPEDDRRVQTIDTIPAGGMQPHDLATALNATTMAALSDWRPAYVIYDQGMPPQHAPPAHVRPNRETGLSTPEQTRRTASMVRDLTRDVRSRGELFWLSSTTEPEASDVTQRRYRVLPPAGQVLRPDTAPPSLGGAAAVGLGGWVELSLSVYDHSRVDAAVYYRASQTRFWRRVSFFPRGEDPSFFVAAIPLGPDSRIEYFVEVLDEHGNLAQQGSSSSPLQFQSLLTPPGGLTPESDTGVDLPMMLRRHARRVQDHALAVLRTTARDRQAESDFLALVDVMLELDAILHPPPLPDDFDEYDILRTTEVVVTPSLDIGIGDIVDALTPEPSPPPPPPLEYKKPAQYERILGAASADADLLILLDPRTCVGALDSSAAERSQRMLDGLVRHLETAGLARLEASARVNRAALSWFAGEPEAAVTDVLAARGQLAAAGDVSGLAHAYEWLGYFLLESGAHQRAAGYFAVALQLFERLENRAAATRLRDYWAPGPVAQAP